MIKEAVFQIAILAYPGLALLYAFWAVLNFGAKNTMTNHSRLVRTIPDWLTGLHFCTQAVAFYLLYFATWDLPIDTNAFSFVIRMWWAAAFVSGLAMTLWHFLAIFYKDWYKPEKPGEDT